LTENYGSSRVIEGPLVKITELDHIGLRVKDVEASLRFYSELLGLKAERVDEWRKGEIGFPSVRLNADTLIDFFLSEKKVDNENKEINQDHFCLVIEPTDMEHLKTRLEELGVRIHAGPGKRWGAHGDATSLYMYDPDQNVVELRHY
jgi:extradiol dioxygenase family protein|tara:strand:+ start:710 stop:1150 length:441 start_codon:yes stop_codon:yes gene_type:complete